MPGRSVGVGVRKKEGKSSKMTVSPAKEETRWGKPTYKTDRRLPRGWSFFATSKAIYYRDAEGKFLKNRRNVLAEMISRGGYSRTEVQYIRDGLLSEGWKYHQDLPPDWMYKQYQHKIEGIDTNILYHLSPDGTIYRSKKMLMKKADDGELGVDAQDLIKLINFKPVGFKEQRSVEEPDDSWVHDPECVPEGWKMRKYCYNNLKSEKVEEVFHYLTPDNTVLRGRKHVYNYMLDTETFNQEDFNKFHFSKVLAPVRSRRPSGSKAKVKRVVTREEGESWGSWGQAEDMPTGWKVRYGGTDRQGVRKLQYQSPNHEVFSTRTKAVRYMKQSGMEMRETKENKRLIESRLSGALTTTWGPWVAGEDIPFLPGWQFSIGHRRGTRRMKYRDREGRVFKSRGSLIRYLHTNMLRKKDQLEVLKKLLKVNQTKHFEELRRNDRFIKHIEVDENYLLFIKARYNNHAVAEVTDPSLPDLWRKKVINGVDYFRDPSGQHVFNSRRLVVEFLRKTQQEQLSDEQLVGILEESDDESDLSESEEDSEGEERDTSGVLEEGEESGELEDEESSAEESLEAQAFVEC